MTTTKTIRCKDCACLKPASYCEWQSAFLSQELLGEAWQCEGYTSLKVVS